MDWLARLDELWPRDGRYVKPLTEEWRQARRGRLTASSAAYPIKVYGKAIETLHQKILLELSPEWHWKELSLPQLDWGREYEPAAIANIELALGVDIVDPGCLFHPRFPYCSATPDGIIDGHISLQIKCPHSPKIHLETFYGKKLKPLYHFQTLWEAWVSGCDQIIFCSFDPEQPLATQLLVRELPVDAQVLEIFETNVVKFRELVERGVSNSGNVQPEGIPLLF